MAQAKAKTTASTDSKIKENKFYVAKEEVVYLDTRGAAAPFTCIVRLKGGDQVKLKSLSELVYL